MKILRYDRINSIVLDGMANFEILDPELENTENTYCIGFRYLGGKISNHENWQYDHTNYWDFDQIKNQQEQLDLQKIEVSEKQIKLVLEKQGSSLQELLEKYLNKINSF